MQDRMSPEQVLSSNCWGYTPCYTHSSTSPSLQEMYEEVQVYTKLLSNTIKNANAIRELSLSTRTFS